MSGHGTFGRFRPLARARPPSGGKISASAALSASARRTPHSARPGSARTRTYRPRITSPLLRRDRDAGDLYLLLVEFCSRDRGVENSGRPGTGEFGALQRSARAR